MKRSVLLFLEGSNARAIEHPGGDLLAHLVRTEGLLASWGSRPALCLAGLCHAAYGTDGFAPSLLEVSNRAALVDLIGVEAEAIVYCYDSCDRGFLSDQIREGGVVNLRDRFSGAIEHPDGRVLADLLELTFANELDLVQVSPAFAATHGPAIAKEFARCERFVSDQARTCFRRNLGHHVGLVD